MSGFYTDLPTNLCRLYAPAIMCKYDANTGIFSQVAQPYK